MRPEPLSCVSAPKPSCFVSEPVRKTWDKTNLYFLNQDDIAKGKGK
jgi:hypothetical protein